MKNHLLIGLFLIATVGFSQTNPTPQNLPFSLDFGTQSFSAMPSGTAVWTVSSSPKGSQSTAESSVANNNATLTATSATQTTGGVYGYATNSNGRFYVQTSSNSTNGTNQLAIAINTNGLQNIIISYDIELVSAQARTVGVVLQYRIGNSGSWTTVDGTAYSHNSNDRTAGQVDSYSNIQLPASINNNSEVQLRWATWRGSESGNSSGLAIDNISISGSYVPSAYYFRSKQSGSWDNITSWEMSSDSTAWINATFVPDYKSKNIIILQNHTITFSGNDTIDQTVINGTLLYSNASNSILTINNGDGTDFIVNGTFEDNGNSNVIWLNNATWMMGDNGTIIKTRSTSSNNWRDRYESGIVNIPATSNWIIRKTTSDSPVLTSTGGMYYPNLIIENNTESLWEAISTPGFTGSSDFPRIKGNLFIGGDGTGNVSFINENTNSTPVLVQGNLTVKSGSILRNYGTGFEIQGNLTINGAVNYDNDGDRKLVFSGGNAQTIAGNGTLNIFNFQINKSSNNVTLNRSITIDNSLTLTSGHITTTTTNLLTLIDNSTSSSGSASSFIDGPLKKIGNDAFTFPIGKNTNYQPLTISAPQNIADSFISEYFNNGQTRGDSSELSITNISSCEYWNIQQGAGSSNVNVTIGWNSNSCNINSPQNMKIAVWDNNKWNDGGNGFYTGNNLQGTVRSDTTLTIYGDLTLANNYFELISDAGNDTTINVGNKVVLGGVPTVYGGVPPYTYTWFPTSGITVTCRNANPIAQPINTTTYYLTVTDAVGDTATDQIVITVPELNPTPQFSNTFELVIKDTITGRDSIPPMYVYDRLGNKILMNDIRIQNNSEIAGMFILHFWDDDHNTNSGFDNNHQLGNDRRAVVIQVFRDLTELLGGTLPLNPYTNNPQYVQINIKQSMNNLASPTLGFAGQYYQEPANLGLAYGSVWRFINSGIDPYWNISDPNFASPSISVNPLYGSGYYHAEVTINFGYNFYLGLDNVNVPSGMIDLYTVVLHEVLHMLGIGSLMTTNSGNISSLPPGFSIWDYFAYVGTPPQKILNYNIDDVSHCDIMHANNNITSSQLCGNMQTINPRFIAPNGPNLELWLDACPHDINYFSHFNCNSSCLNVMRPNLGYGEHFRFPATEEVQALCAIGYNVTNVFGEGGAVLNSSNNHTITYINPCLSPRLIAGANDFYTNGTSGGSVFTVSDGGSIDFFYTGTVNNIIGNDYNATNISCPRMFMGDGDLTFNSNGFSFSPGNISASLGKAIIAYNPINQLGQRGNTAYIFITVTPQPLTPCSPQQCGLICHGDFEDISNNNALHTFFANFRVNQCENSPDLYSYNNNNYVMISAYTQNQPSLVFEGITFELLRSINPNCTANITFNASALMNPSGYNSNVQIRILGSTNPPCSLPSEINSVNCNTPSIQCPSFNPICMTTGTITNLCPTPYNNFGEPNLQPYQLTWYNNLTIPINHVTIVCNPSTGFLVLDDFQIYTSCETPLSITATPLDENPCINTSTSINYEICLNQFVTENASDIILQADFLQSGLNYGTGGDFVNGQAIIPAGTLNSTENCINLTLNIDVTNGAYGGVPQNIEISATSQEFCFEGNTSNIVTIIPGWDNILTISKTVSGPTVYNVNDIATYSIEVCNTSTTNPISGIVVKDIIDNSLDFISNLTSNFNITGHVITSNVFNLNINECIVMSYTTKVINDGCGINNCAGIINANGICNLPIESCVSINTFGSIVVDNGCDISVCSGIQPVLNSTVSNGTTPYSYSWSPASSLNNASIANPTASPTTTTTYTVTVTDANGCTSTSQITVFVNPVEFDFITNIVNESCFGSSNGSIDIEVSGGVSPYSFIWLNSDNQIIGYNEDVSNLIAGTYHVVVTDDNGCSTFENIIVENAHPDAWPYQPLNGDYREAGKSVGVGLTGNVFVSGDYTNNISFGSYHFTSTGTSFIVKLDECAQVLWAKSIPGDCGINKLIVDPNDDFIITGSYSGSVDFGNNHFTTNPSGMFVAKYLWDSNTNDYLCNWLVDVIDAVGHDLATDENNDIYLAGTIQVNSQPDVYVAKYDGLNGSPIWDDTENSGVDNGYGITYCSTCPAGSKVLVTGVKSNPAPEHHMFISVYSETAGYISTSININELSIGNKIISYQDPATSTNYAFIAGYTILNYENAIAVRKIDLTNLSSFIPSFTSAYAPDIGNVAKDIAIDPNGDLFITGHFRSSSLSFQGVSDALVNNGWTDNFVAKYSIYDNNFLWAINSGSIDVSEQSIAICINNNGFGYVTGYFNGDAQFGDVTLTSVYSGDVFVARIHDLITDGEFKKLPSKPTNKVTVDEISVYPNPTTNILNIEFSNKNSTFVKCKLFNVIGSCILNQNLKDGKTQIDMSNFPAGIYILKVETTNKVYDYKIVKQ